MKKRGLNYDPILTTDVCKLIDTVQETVIANKRGFIGSYIETEYNLLFGLTSMGNDIGTEYSLFDSNRFFSELNKIKIEDIVAKRTLELRSQERISSGKYTIYLEPYMAAEFLEYIDEALDGDSIYKNISFLSDYMGKEIGNSNINLIDDATLKGQIGSMPFDAEGLKVKRKYLIENGIIKTALHDLYSASKAGAKPTANAIQNSYLRTYGISSFNLILDEGKISDNDMLSDIKKGIYLYSMTDTGGVDTISGNFSVEAKGILIENGKLTSPLNHLTLASNLFDMIKNMRIANNSTWVDDICTPSFAIDNVIVSCD